jgi:AcrR family transcriptional regulator
MATLQKGDETRQRILTACRRIISEAGAAALTFDAVAQDLGVSKQAVLYWFPTKQDLLRELMQPWIRGEAEAVCKALRRSTGAADAIRRTVRVLVRFHMADLDRFRQVYLGVQLDPKPYKLIPKAALEAEIHPVTGAMYGALESALMQDPKFRSNLSARRVAVAVHTATLGLLLMVGMAEAIEDSLAHRTEDLVATLIALLATGVEG